MGATCLMAVSSDGSQQVVDACLPFMHAWRNRFNKGDAAYCGGQYLPDASLLVRLGPVLNVASRRVELLREADGQGSVTFHGRKQIATFWSAAVEQLGLEKFAAYEDTGENAVDALALDEKTVLASGKFHFGAAAAGHF